MGRPEIMVIGAGVSGLTCAVQLAEARHTVRLIAERPPLGTTSVCAGASWVPHWTSDPRTAAWTEVTRAKLEKISTDADTGVHLKFGLEVSEDPGDPPPWAPGMPDFQPCTVEELPGPPGKYRSGWRYTTPVIDMTAYLPYLHERLVQAGGTVNFDRSVRSLDELRGAADVVINCTGLGAHRLVPDKAVSPVRGQVVVLENPGLEEFFQDSTFDGDLTYIHPHAKRVVLGGTATERDGDPKVHRETSREIRRRCEEIEPRLKDAAFVTDLVGLRPSRPSVRLEDTEDEGFRVIHNYGHGGAGVSMSWGCAEEVVRLVN